MATIETKTETVFEKLPHRLTEDELRDKGKEQARVYSDLQKLESDKKIAVMSYNGEIKAANALIGDLAQMVNTGVEYRETECERAFYYDEGEVVTRRMDTLQIIETRPMTRAERQMKMDL